LAVASETDPIPGTQTLPQFQHAAADGLAIAKSSGFKALQGNPDLGLGLLVAQRLKPLGDRLLATGGLSLMWSSA
jgi:hypothetical protein